ncbi:MAG TPA: hypothetical protein VFV25_07125 [Methylibium sp.]
MDEPTIPFGEPELWRVSAFRHAMGELSSRPDSADLGARLSLLSPSLMADLQRFEHAPNGAEVLEVMAACLRHSQNVAIHLERTGYVLPITVFPRQRIFHSPLPLSSLLDASLAELKLLQVEPAVLRAPGDKHRELVDVEHLYHPLGGLLWVLALYGPRKELLPEIAGPAAYRVAPGMDLRGLDIGGALASAIDRLRGEAVPLRVIAEWPGLDLERAARLLNGLYLQSGLMVSRTHPTALSLGARADGWLQSLTRRRSDN